MGGKSYIADWIVSKFPKHSTYVEVFGGGASVLFYKPRVRVEVYNDTWDDITNLFLVLRDKWKELKQYLHFTPTSHTLYEIYRKKLLETRDFKDDIERAAVTFFLLRTSANANITHKWLSHRDRNPAIQIKSIADDLETYAERFRGVVIENLDFRKCIKNYDTGETMFYCDPPYMGLKYYSHSFEYRDHYELAKNLSEIEGKVAVSYYPHKEVFELYPKDIWNYSSIEVKKHSFFAIENVEKPSATELLITNYKPPMWHLKSTSKRLGEVFG